MIVFFDRSMAKKVGRRLRWLGVEVRLHDDFLAQSDEDELGMSLAGGNGWAYLTCDRGAIKRNSPYQHAILHYGVACFVFPRVSHCTALEKFRAVVRHCEFIRDVTTNQSRPFLYRLPRAGHPTQDTLPDGAGRE